MAGLGQRRQQFTEGLKTLWADGRFVGKELSAYAEARMFKQVRDGIMLLGLVALMLLSCGAAFYAWIGLDQPLDQRYVYTFSVLALLALNTIVSSLAVKQTRILYLLAITLLVMSGSAFVLLAHQTGSLNAALLSSVVLLFMVVPLVPWGVREASLVVVLIYLVFTLSTFSVSGRFEEQTLWGLQFLMIGSALITLIVVARNAGVRRQDIESHYLLEQSRQEMELLSFKDPLTGAWNRRFLEHNFAQLLEDLRRRGEPCHLALLDLDDFKGLNDSCGHQAGDLALQRLVRVLQEQLDPTALVIRLGGDEFLLLLAAADPQALLAGCAEALLRDPLLRRQPSMRPVRFSVGLSALVGSGECNLEQAYRTADQALYSAKRNRTAPAAARPQRPLSGPGALL
ncbi:GGDEF domain-containing protein [Pseudomonas benzenivorans]|uniref:diguanylate cyclase n=1 Tax=Pseudomonas benzenivorans TaxID=556533 RepID=A0ABY5H4Y1_9PSED|nr:diguanylate cyclase [Pseudomonas benzenivorans]UTW07134.1 diguanylate cyclase [Pseudomonas benzenivorans]